MANTEPLSVPVLDRELQSLPDWKVSGGAITASFRFPDFRFAMMFMNMVGMECDHKDHHPDWSNSYNKVSISFSTHDAGGKVTDKDIKLADYASRAARDLKGVPHAD